MKKNMTPPIRQTAIISADFETTQKGELSVWGYVYKNIFYYGTTLQTFFDSLKNHKRKIYVYFHNLSSFDGEYIIKGINNVCRLSHRLRAKKHNKCDFYKQKPLGKEGNVINYFTKNTIRDYELKTEFGLKNNEWSMSMDSNRVYNIKVGQNMMKRNNKFCTIIDFRCSKMMFNNMGIKDMGKQLNENFEKGEIDYKKIFLYKTKDDIPLDLKIYLERDCRILDKYIKKQIKILPFTKWKITIGSTAYNLWKISAFQNLAKNILNDPVEVVPAKRNPNYVNYKWGDKFYNRGVKGLANAVLNKVFPTEWLDESLMEDDNLIHKDLLKEYFKGGIVHAKRNTQGKILKNISIFDITSMYPHQMVTKFFPYGNPFFGDGGKDYPLKLYKIKWSSFTTKAFPIIPQYFDYGSRYFPIKKSTNGISHITDIELEYLNKYYIFKNLKKEILYSFKAIEGKKVFGDYVFEYFDKKNNSKGPARSFYKLFLNSVYGKFGTKSNRTSKLFDEKEKDFVNERKQVKSNYYLPLAIWITAYGRVELGDAVALNYKHFYYCDTDSIHIDKKYKDLFNLDIGSNLGQWKEERIGVDACYRRSKQYAYIDNNKMFVRLAGGKNPKVDSLEEFKNGFRFIDLQKKRVKTGIILEDMVKVIPYWKDYPDWNVDLLKEDKDLYWESFINV